ncbi:MAG: carboxypeptidase regulatory-like domain-containing protein [Acidobacteriia bacterium]|nr:carboxypeptidase regulatory-like domain-containing protein [Terriglobia bacterium]
MPRVIAPVLTFAALILGQTTGSVEGTVVDRVTGAGIPGASITFYIRTQAVFAEATTDASGDFRIFGMKPGSYEVRFEKEGYRPGNRIPAKPYIVGESPSPVRIRLEMTRLVSLSGRVVDSEGNPMSQGEVKIVDGITVPVAADGTFVMKDLEPGSYSLAAVPRAIAAPEGARVPVITYSPERIVIRGDADVSSVEVRLLTAEVYRVSGVVLDETGNPKAGAEVQLLPKIQTGARVATMGQIITMVGPGPSTGPVEARVVSGEDGSFAFPAIRSGEWQLAAVSRGNIDAANFNDTVRSGAVDVVVGNRNVGNLQIRLAASFKVTGTVDWGDFPKQRVDIMVSSVGRQSVFPGLPRIDPDGTVSLGVAPARKSLILPLAGPGYYPVSVLLGGQEVLGKPVDLFPGATFRVAYRAANGSVHGTVENGSGATVLLIPDNVLTMGFGRMVTCKADGTFDMNGVPPGEYYAAAVVQFQQSPGADTFSALLPRIAAIGTRVSVGQTAASVELKLNPSVE